MSHYTRITANSDTIVINLSQYLYDAGKTESMVIGHSTEANPIYLQLKERSTLLEKALPKIVESKTEFDIREFV